MVVGRFLELKQPPTRNGHPATAFKDRPSEMSVYADRRDCPAFRALERRAQQSQATPSPAKLSARMMTRRWPSLKCRRSSQRKASFALVRVDPIRRAPRPRGSSASGQSVPANGCETVLSEQDLTPNCSQKIAPPRECAKRITMATFRRFMSLT